MGVVGTNSDEQVLTKWSQTATLFVSVFESLIFISTVCFTSPRLHLLSSSFLPFTWSFMVDMLLVSTTINCSSSDLADHSIMSFDSVLK
ncbi:hypothetical protein Hdeb2414_s1216g00993541 [Helianthus debilis subsp. tardiflorus]